MLDCATHPTYVHILSPPNLHLKAESYTPLFVHRHCSNEILYGVKTLVRQNHHYITSSSALVDENVLAAITVTTLIVDKIIKCM